MLRTPGEFRRAAVAALGGVTLVAASATLAARPTAPPESLVYRHVATWDVPAVLLEPLDVALAPGGRLYVADGRRNAVRVYDAEGSLLTMWDRPGAVAFCDPLVPFAVAVDARRGIVYSGWHCYMEGRLSPSPFYLGARRLDGSEVRPLVRVRVVSATDIDVMPDSGQLFVAGARRVSRVRPGDGSVAAEFDVTGIGGAIKRLAVTGADRLALIRSGVSRVVRLRVDGSQLTPIDLAGRWPVAVAGGPGGQVAVLVSAPRSGSVPRATPPAAGDAMIMVFAGNGSVLRSETPADVGAPMPPASAWPWGLAMTGSRLAFTTAARRFEVHWLTGAADRGGILGGPTLTNFRPRVWAARAGNEAFAVAAAPDGGGVVLDTLDGLVVRFSADGEAEIVAPAPAQAVDLAVGAEGEVYVTTARDTVQRLAAEGAGGWEVPCACDLGGRLGAGRKSVLLTRPRDRTLTVLDADSGAETAQLSLGSAVGLWPGDVAVLDGDPFTSELPARRVRRWSGGRPGEAWVAGLSSGPRRLGAGGGTGSAEAAVVAVLTGDDWVEVHRAADGALVSRWRVALSDGTQAVPEDVAVATDGRLLLADAVTRAVHLFRSTGASATPGPEPSATAPRAPTPSAASCQVTTGRTASPPRVAVGQPVTVSLAFEAECPGGNVAGHDLVLAIDTSSSMAGVKLAAARAAARSFAERLDVRYHRLGLVAFSNNAVVAAPLTADVALVIDAVRDLRASGRTNLSSALERALEVLDAQGRPEAAPVIILLSDGNNAGGTRSPRDVAREAAQKGVGVVTIALSPNDVALLRDMASRPDYYFYAASPEALEAIYSSVLATLAVTEPGNLAVEDDLAAEVDLVADSPRPKALFGGGRLSWAFPPLSRDPVTMTYVVVPRVTGDLLVGRRGVADYTDADGARRRVHFPTARVQVATATPAVSPTPTPRLRVAWLPWLAQGACLLGAGRTDVALVLDASRSMGELMPDGRSKLTAAVETLDALVARLPAPSRVALVVFGDDAGLAAPLTGDKAAVRAALRGVIPGGESRLDRGLAAGRRALAKGRPARALVLLSDGRVAPGVAAAAVAEAEAAKAAGIAVYAVGIGGAVDAVTLRRVASGDQFWWALSAQDLEDIRLAISRDIPCPGGGLPPVPPRRTAAEVRGGSR